MSQPSRRFSFIALAFLGAGALLGGLLGHAQADAQKPDEQLWTFGKLVALVEDNYVGTVDSKELMQDAISGMLRTLDPHSNYLDLETFTEMRDEQRGKFHGLGIQITKRGADKPLTIIAPIDDTPADRAGLRSGDIIAMIEGEPTIEMTVTQAVRLLKGDKGTEVTITIERPGTTEPFEVTIERDEIPIESIRLAYMLEPGVGLIRISNFTSTTAEELDAAIERMTDEGMTRLILDLRGNPGGLLDQAVQVAERFIPADELIVYTRGRISGSDKDFRAKRGVKRTEVPLVVLVDRSSASASEIVSGAIQDHDRGLVVGETTFGKGLVQRVIPLHSGGAVAVTTAKYYTPSGRLIQRDYSDLEEYYLMRPEEIDESPDSLEPADSEDEVERQVFYTASKREVYGGGGIQPDHIVPSPMVPAELLRLERDNLLFEFAVLFTNSHADLERGFDLNEEILDKFRAFLREREVEVPEEAFEKHGSELALRLEAQIARVKWDAIEQDRVLNRSDPQVQRALELFDEAARLAKLGEYRPTDEDRQADSTPPAL